MAWRLAADGKGDRAMVGYRQIIVDAAFKVAPIFVSMKFVADALIAWMDGTLSASWLSSWLAGDLPIFWGTMSALWIFFGLAGKWFWDYLGRYRPDRSAPPVQFEEPDKVAHAPDRSEL